MIAPDARIKIVLRPGNNTVGIGPVSDEIATADNSVVCTPRVFEDRLQRFPITMNVTYDEIAHPKPGTAQILKATTQ